VRKDRPLPTMHILRMMLMELTGPPLAWLWEQISSMCQRTLKAYNYTYVVVYARSVSAEMRTPVGAVAIADEFSLPCDAIPDAGCGLTPPAAAGSCSPANGCTDCDLNADRRATVDAATQGSTAIIAHQEDRGCHDVMSKLYECSMTDFAVTYFNASGGMAPVAVDPVVPTCKYTCQPGSDVCSSCFPEPTEIPADDSSTADGDGTSVWRYLACRHRNVQDAAESEITYSYVFGQGEYLGSGAEVAEALNCDALALAAAAVSPFDLNSVSGSFEGGVCSLSAMEA